MSKNPDLAHALALDPRVAKALANGIITDTACSFAQALVVLANRADHDINLDRLVSKASSHRERVMAVLLATGREPIDWHRMSLEFGANDPFAALARDMGIVPDEPTAAAATPVRSFEAQCRTLGLNPAVMRKQLAALGVKEENHARALAAYGSADAKGLVR